MTTARSRSGAEWVTFAAASAVLSVLIAAIGWLWINDDVPARIEARTVGVEQIADDQLEITVDVVNVGDGTAVDVQVIGEVQAVEGPEQFGEQTVDFLTGGETSTIVFIAPTTDPSAVVVRIGGYSQP